MAVEGGLLTHLLAHQLEKRDWVYFKALPNKTQDATLMTLLRDPQNRYNKVVLRRVALDGSRARSSMRFVSRKPQTLQLDTRYAKNKNQQSKASAGWARNGGEHSVQHVFPVTDSSGKKARKVFVINAPTVLIMVRWSILMIWIRKPRWIW